MKPKVDKSEIKDDEVYKDYIIKPKRDFGKYGYLINGKRVWKGFVVVDKRNINVMPGATWFQTTEDAKKGIDVLIKYGEKTFGKVIKMKIKDKIVKNNTIIEKLLKVVKEELERLPDKSVFGDSNDESKAELRVWIRELESALEGKLTINSDSEVYWWLVGDNDTLAKDYDVNED